MSGVLEVFEESMNLREDADYALDYSEQGASEALEDAEIFFEKSQKNFARWHQRSYSFPGAGRRHSILPRKVPEFTKCETQENTQE